MKQLDRHALVTPFDGKGGIDFPALSQAFTLPLFGGFEYWSDTPIANYPEVPGTTAFVDRTELFAVKAGITATVALGGR